jgi:hypothetical protein
MYVYHHDTEEFTLLVLERSEESSSEARGGSATAHMRVKLYRRRSRRKRGVVLMTAEHAHGSFSRCMRRTVMARDGQRGAYGFGGDLVTVFVDFFDGA